VIFGQIIFILEAVILN